VSTRLQGAAAAALLLVSIGVFAWRCAREPRIAFIVQDEAAPWIMFPQKPTGLMGLAERDALPVTTFLRRFDAGPEPARDAVLSIRALRSFELSLNGEDVALPAAESGHWRVPRRVSLAGRLRPGANELLVKVRNATGPAMLALRIDGLDGPLLSDGAWRVSFDGGPWRAARRVDASRSNPSSYAMPDPGRSVTARADTLLALFVASALLFLGSRTRLGRRLAPLAPRVLTLLLLGVWLALLARSLEIPTTAGFDAHHHVKYVEFLREQHHLPLATDGWMMFHPPAYYVPTALLVELQEHIAPGSLLGWKLLGWLAGLSTALLCGALGARTFGPGTREAALALGFGALVPMNLYISSYVTNESLHTALACGVVVLTAGMLRSGAPPWRRLLGWAVVVGVALLTKYTAWIVAAVAGFFLVARWLLVERASAGVVARRVAAAGALVLLLAGWFYARNLHYFGQPFPLNVDLPGETKQWWSQPGYYTPAFFLRFGGALVHPFLAGYHSAWDSFYSTLWGDGQLGGQVVAALRHPYWDWELMAAGYWLALPATLLLVFGALSSLGLAFRAADPGLRALHSFLLTLAYALLLSVLYMTLRQQDYGQAKSFYAMATVAPLSAFFALGCGRADRWLEARDATWARALLHGWLGCFAGVVALSFAG
jgi:hypothetical protein